MNKDEELELLLEVYREQPLVNKTLKDLADMVEVRSVNFSVEEKLDKIIELLEKLTNKTTVINAPISVKSEESNNVDINKHLYELVNKVERRKVVDKPKTNYSLDIYLGLMDDKGNIISKQLLHKQEDGKDEQSEASFVCEPITKDMTVVGWGLKKKVYKVRVYDAAKVFVGWLGDDGVVELVKPKNIDARCMYIAAEPTSVNRPGIYKAEWYVEKEGELVEYIPHVFINEITVERKEPQASPSYYVTGYLTQDGRAVYYDQYL